MKILSKTGKLTNITQINTSPSQNIGKKGKKTKKKNITLPRHYQTLAKCYKLLSKSLENITKPWKKIIKTHKNT